MPHHVLSSPSEDDRTISATHRLIAEMQAALDRTMAVVLAPLDMSMTDYYVLDDIFRVGRIDLTTLERHLPMDRFAIARAVQGLVDRSCLVPQSELNRFHPPFDMTAAGQDLHARANVIVMAMEDSLAKRLDGGFADHVSAAIDTLQAIRDFTRFAAERHREDPEDAEDAEDA